MGFVRLIEDNYINANEILAVYVGQKIGEDGEKIEGDDQWYLDVELRDRRTLNLFAHEDKTKVDARKRDFLTDLNRSLSN